VGLKQTGHGRSGQSLWHHGLRRGLQPGLGFRADAIQWRLDLQIASRFLRGGYPCSDGRFPLGNVVFDTSGHLYGTAEQGGTDDGGVVWEITP